MAPLPTEDFECGITLTPKVDRTSRITVRQSHYSVPAYFIGERVRVLLRGNELLIIELRRGRCQPSNARSHNPASAARRLYQARLRQAGEQYVTEAGCSTLTVHGPCPKAR
ncbi:Mu transposase domain-containing protein [Streptomyces sp. JNUCC 63]